MKNHDEEPSDVFKTKVTPVASFEIPGFRIISELGRGAFGVVYRANDETLDRLVAVKVALVDEPARRNEYIQEAQKAAKLAVDGIVPVYQVGRLENGRPFVVQMLLEGGTLRQEMKRLGRISPSRTCELMIRIAGAVSQAHAVGLIHRDLKPDNILLDARGQPWIADFGLALIEADQRRHKGEKAGTPLYMSPEQIMGRAEWLDGRADIYALGVTFYELLVGKPPYTAQSREELEDEILRRDPKPLTQYLTGIPHEIDSIFRKCCAKQTSDRYANALELVRDLEIALQLIPNNDVQFNGSTRLGGSLGSTRQSVRSTRRDSFAQTQRDPFEAPAPKSVPWLAIVLAVFGGFACLVWYFESRPAAKPDVGQVQPFSETAGEEAHGKGAIASSRPFELRVSQKLDSKIKTIGEAIRLAEPGERIYVETGRYEENLVITKDIELVGSEPQPTIASSSSDTLKIQGGATVTLKNLFLDNLAEKGNTIHVEQGSVTVSNCKIYATSYPCVRALEETSVRLTQSKFRNGAHEAVYAKGVKLLDVEGCTFNIISSGNEEIGKHSYGINARDCEGRISGSTFVGQGQQGVVWQNATGLVSIENNTFKSCDYAIHLVNVAQGAITGKTKMSDCVNGIVLRDSAVTIRGLEMKGTDKPKSFGISASTEKNEGPARLVSISDSHLEGFAQALDVLDKSVDVKLENVEFQGNESGVHLKLAHSATVKGCTFRDGGIGIQLVDVAAEVQDCTLMRVQNGISQRSPFDSRKGLVCERSTFTTGGPRSSAIKLYSGWADLKGLKVQSFEDPLVIEQPSVPDKSGLGGEPEMPGNVQRKLDVASLALDDCKNELTVRSSCELRIDRDYRIGMNESKFVRKLDAEKNIITIILKSENL